MSLEEIARNLFKLEEMFRNLATDLQLNRATWYNVPKVISEAKSIIENVKSAAERIVKERPIMSEEYVIADQVLRITEDVQRALETLSRARIDCMGRGLDPKSCTVNMYDVLKLENDVMRLTGTACAFKASNTYTSFMNDLSSCIHRVAEKVSEGLKWELREACRIAPNSSREAVDFCLTWSKMTELLYNNKLYHYDDFGELAGWVIGDKVYLRVGSASGHRTEVDLKSGTIKYYDTNDNVNEMIASFLEEHGLKCNVIYGIGVECEGLSRENYRNVAMDLAFATSMDLRLSNPSMFYTKIVKEHVDMFKKLFKK